MTPPDLNTLPKSPRESSTPSLPKPTTPSRRQSHIMNRRPSQHSQSDEGDVPIRHPRPLTTAELHLEMEQEQEAAVHISPSTPAQPTANAALTQAGQSPGSRTLRPPRPTLRLHSLQRLLSNQRHRHPTTTTTTTPAPDTAYTRPIDTTTSSLLLLPQRTQPGQYSCPRLHSPRLTSLRRASSRRSRHALTGELARKRYRYRRRRRHNARLAFSTTERKS